LPRRRVAGLGLLLPWLRGARAVAALVGRLVVVLVRGVWSFVLRAAGCVSAGRRGGRGVRAGRGCASGATFAFLAWGCPVAASSVSVVGLSSQARSSAPRAGLSWRALCGLGWRSLVRVEQDPTSFSGWFAVVELRLPPAVVGLRAAGLLGAGRGVVARRHAASGGWWLWVPVSGRCARAARRA